MSIGFTRRDMLQLIGVGATSMALPKRLQGAQKDGEGKQAAGKPLTFFGWSDTHIPAHGDGSKLWPAIEAMNLLPGKAYPKNIGGVVDTPAFVFNCGDITEWPTHQATKIYEDLISKRLRYPSYEILGNHDEAGADGVEGAPPIMKEWFKRRYGDLSYTFDQGGIHFVCPSSPSLVQQWFFSIVLKFCQPAGRVDVKLYQYHAHYVRFHHSAHCLTAT